MRYRDIAYEKMGAVARLTMNRPRYRNALSRRLIEELDDGFAAAVDDDNVRVIILAGAGEHFSSGHDLGTPDELGDANQRPFADGVRGRYERSWRLYVDTSLRWRELPKPTIAQVQGYCIFGAWIIASAMDLIVAADDAKLLASHFQYFSVPWDLGERKTKEILFQNRFIGAREAMELGFVNRVVPREKLEAETLALAESIAQTDPFATRVIKFSVNQAQDAMGFRTSVRSAHMAYMLLELAGLIRSPDDEEAGRRVLSRVADALEKLKTEGIGERETRTGKERGAADGRAT
jgi:enoyl-CoA hydratase